MRAETLRNGALKAARLKNAFEERVETAHRDA